VTATRPTVRSRSLVDLERTTVTVTVPGTGGGLPVAGTNGALLGPGGAALLLAGVAGVLATRRRTRFVA
jgi:predicted phage tail protein